MIDLGHLLLQLLVILVAARLAGRAIQFIGQPPVIGEMIANTRGLMELVILNVGLDIGVISPALFAMMVLMALVTTAMTSPLLQALLRRQATEPVEA